MAIIVMKFGGTSVANTERIKHVASLIKREVERGNQVAAVVSAMSGATNQLVAWAEEVSSLANNHALEEYDSVVASGEQVTAGLTALALQTIGVPARSWLGWQIGLLTDDLHSKARIEEIDATALKASLGNGEVAVMAGFQGVTADQRITTLGRGGSDTSAVALAAALGAERCDIYTDVDGVYTSDPRIVPKARKLNKIAYEEMLEMASAGAKVLQLRSVEMAMKHNVRVQVLSSFQDIPGSLLVNEEEIMERRLITGVTCDRNEVQIAVRKLPDRPGVAAAVFAPLSQAGINVDMIIQNVSADGQTADITFTVTKTDAERAIAALEEQKNNLGFEQFSVNREVAKVAVIGVGMRSHAGLAQTMFQTLSDKAINILAITTSEIKISVLIAEEAVELAMRALHSAYGLDAKAA
jgi:aspartate kinase